MVNTENNLQHLRISPKILPHGFCKVPEVSEEATFLYFL